MSSPSDCLALNLTDPIRAGQAGKQEGVGERETEDREAEKEVREGDTAEEEVRGKGEEEGDDERRPGVVTDVVNTAEREAEKLQEGRTLPFFAGPLPMRAVVAIGIFAAVFLVSWLILWALLGGVGLGLGWIVAGVLGFLAVKWAADRMAAG